MEFNDDGTIKTLIPDMRGVGYLAASQETRPNLALQSHFYASSEKSPRTSVVNIETQPNQPLPEKGSVKSYTRTHTYQATHVADESNGTRWMAADTDSSPFITVDLKESVRSGSASSILPVPLKDIPGDWRSLSTENIGRCVLNKGKYKYALHILLRR